MTIVNLFDLVPIRSNKIKIVELRFKFTWFASHCVYIDFIFLIPVNPTGILALSIPVDKMQVIVKKNSLLS